MADTIEINRIYKFQKADTVKLSYYSPVDTIHYTFLKSKGDSASTVDFFGYQGPIRALKDTTIVIGREVFNVTVYIINEFAEDGRTIHYYSPEIGVFAIHSSVFYRFWQLQTNNTTENRKIDKLIKSIVPKHYIRRHFPTAEEDK